jgi:hypothetical protein
MRLAAALLPTKVEIAKDPIAVLGDEALEAYGAEIDEMNRRILERAEQGDPVAIERARKLGLLPTP